MPRVLKDREEIMCDENDLIVCRCEEVTRKDILETVRNGANSVNAVKKQTRAGMGFCQGKTCGNLIRRILAQETGLSEEDLYPGTYRLPIRAINVYTLLSRRVE